MVRAAAALYTQDPDILCVAGDGVLTPAISGELVLDWSAQRLDLDTVLKVLTQPKISACTHTAALQQSPRTGAVTLSAACLGRLKCFSFSAKKTSKASLTRTEAKKGLLSLSSVSLPSRWGQLRRQCTSSTKPL